jgi:hypothetical protein
MLPGDDHSTATIDGAVEMIAEEKIDGEVAPYPLRDFVYADIDDRGRAGAEPGPPSRWRRLSERIGAPGRGRLKDLGFCLAFVAIGWWTTGGLWPDPSRRAIGANPVDQALIEWFLAHGTLVWSGDFQFVTDRLNSPDGVNLMANASHITHGVLMAPITLMFGAPVSFAILLTGNLVATAIGWYLLFSRTLAATRPAAALGAALCGFAPGMMAQSNAHLHMTAQWLVPPIVWCVIRLARAHRDTVAGWQRRLAGTAGGLGLLVAVQLLLGEEVLLLTAVSLVGVVLLYAILAPRPARQAAPRFLIGAIIAAGAATILVAYPLSVQFFGRQSVPNGPFSPRFFYADLASYFKFSPLSLAGTDADPHMNGGDGEYNTFYGTPLLLVTLGATLWLARDAARRPIALASAAMAILWGWLSLGPTIVINGKPTTHKGLYALLEKLPVIDGALPTRFALAMTPLIATILVLAVDKAMRSVDWSAGIVPIAVAVSLLPIAPTPMAIVARDPVPTFISAGYWRTCVQPGGVLVPVPLPGVDTPEGMRWAAAANDAFALPQGRFIAPYAAGGKASLGIYPRPTSQLLTGIDRSGQLPGLGPDEIAQAQRDVAYWKAQCIVLAPRPNAPALHRALDVLYGPGQPVADVWIWRVG